VAPVESHTTLAMPARRRESGDELRVPFSCKSRAQVHEVIRAADDDLDIDPALAACLQLSLAGPGPAPGFHMTRYYGVLASHHRLRERVIPSPPYRHPGWSACSRTAACPGRRPTSLREAAAVE
jgi:hypothetical protein